MSYLDILFRRLFEGGLWKSERLDNKKSEVQCLKVNVQSQRIQ